MGDMAEIKGNCVLFGSSGHIGSSLKTHLESDAKVIEYDRTSFEYSIAIEPGSIRYVVFAQGVNHSSSIKGATNLLRESFEANVNFVMERIEELMSGGFLHDEAAIVIVSSIWQRHSRAGKIPYVTSKSAIEGLVKSLSAELGGLRRINAVLPGVVDSPMTRSALSHSQIEAITAATPLGRLISEEDLHFLVEFLLSHRSSGITGQSILIDGGWTSNVRL